MFTEALPAIKILDRDRDSAGDGLRFLVGVGARELEYACAYRSYTGRRYWAAITPIDCSLKIKNRVSSIFGRIGEFGQRKVDHRKSGRCLYGRQNAICLQ